MQLPRETATQQVIDYVMENEPCTGPQIIEALNLRRGAVTSILSRLKKKGMVRRVRLTKTKALVWEMVPEYAEPPPQPIRPSVSSWTPYHFRHWMDVALFGPALIATA